MKVIIVAYHFLPYFPSFGGVARVFYLYRLLKSKGFDVKIVTAKGMYFGYFGLENEIDKNDIFYVESKFNTKKSNLSQSKSNKSYFKRFVKQVYDLFVIPDYSIFDVHSFLKVVLELNQESDHNIIISTPKHGISLLTIFLRRNVGTRKIILDYRDSWNTTTIFKKKNRVSNAVSVFLERKVLSKIDYFTYVSPVVVELIKDELDINLTGKSKLIYNGYEPLKNSQQKLSVLGSKSLIYFGSASDNPSSYRCVSTLIEVSSKIPDLCLDFYGELELSHISLNDYKNISYKGSVPTRELYSYVNNYTWSVILHTDEGSAREVIPGKFYDCLKFEMPILCICPVNSQVSKMVIDLGVGVVLDPIKLNVDSLISVVDNVSLLKSIHQVYQNNDFSFFSRDNQLENFIDILREDSEYL